MFGYSLILSREKNETQNKNKKRNSFGRRRKKCEFCNFPRFAQVMYKRKLNEKKSYVFTGSLHDKTEALSLTKHRKQCNE